MIFVDRADIIDLINGLEVHIFHTDFLPLIDKRQSTEHKIHCCKQFLTVERKVSIRDVVADTTRFIMVFYNIGKITDIPDTLLGVETAFLIIVRSDGFAVIPAVRASSENGRGEVKHAGKISAISDEIRKFFVFFIKNFTYGKSIVRAKGARLHFT